MTQRVLFPRNEYSSQGLKSLIAPLLILSATSRIAARCEFSQTLMIDRSSGSALQIVLLQQQRSSGALHVASRASLTVAIPGGVGSCNQTVVRH